MANIVREQRIEKNKKEYALSSGEYYEYDVETSINKIREQKKDVMIFERRIKEF